MRPLQLLLAACVLLCLAVPAAAQETPTPTPALPATALPAPAAAPSAEDVLTRAQDVADNAGRAIDVVNTMLGYLQAVGLILTVALGAGAILGLRSSQTLREDVQRELGEARQDFTGMLSDAQSRLRSFEGEAAGELDKIKSYAEQATTNLGAIQARVENAVNALTLVQLGKLQIENRNWNAAMRTFNAAHVSDPTNRAANYYLGELYIIERNLDQAIRLLRDAQPNDEIFPPAEAAMAYALRLQGERMGDHDERNRLFAEAERRYLNALAIEPGARDIHDASVRAGLGALYRRQGRLDDALRAYEQAEVVTPYHSYPLINLAILYLHKGETAKAEHHFRTVADISERRLESNPLDEWTRYDAVTARVGMNQPERAQAHLDAIFQNRPSRGPLESFVGGLVFMAEAKAAPDAVHDVLERARQRLQEIRQQEAITGGTSG